jgi:lysyl-tRNA synthetase, class I
MFFKQVFSTLEKRLWFQALYETLLGQQTGPRMGSFIHLYGIDKTIFLIQDALQRS